MAPPALKWKEDRRAEVEEALRESRTREEAAKRIGVSVPSLAGACIAYGLRPHELLGRGAETVTVHVPPPPGLDVEELVAHLEARYKRTAAHDAASKLVPIDISDDRPIGLLAFGDLHLDDPGANIPLVKQHAALVRETPGLWGITPGDFLNNWVGRLTRLYGTQNVTQPEGWQLVEWFFALARDWMFVVQGNHDVWTGPGSPVEWISKRSHVWAEKHDVRVELRFANKRSVRVHCRHDFPGRSMWNDSHGPLRAALLGYRDHVKIAGHTHVSSYQIVPDADSGIAMHLLRVAGYKMVDEYPKEKGLLGRSLGPSAVLVIDPRLSDDHPDLVHVFRDPLRGAEYLTTLRAGRKRRAA